MTSRWKQDVLERQTLAERLTPILKSHTSGAVIGVEGDFGSGKTYFLTDFRAHLEEAGLACVYFNAWESDFAENPLLVLMAEIMASLHGLAPETAATEKMKDAAKRLWPIVARVAAKSVLRAGSDELDALLGPLDEEVDAIFASGKDRKLTRQELINARTALKDLVDVARSSSPDAFPLIVLVDELDRSNPHWVVTFLESVKHLLGQENIVFLIAIDRSNLTALLKHEFGQDYAVDDYLSKFFNYSIVVQDAAGDKQFLTQQLNAANLVADGLLNTDDSLARGLSAAAGGCIFGLGGKSGKLRRLERCAERISLCLRAAKQRQLGTLVGFLVGLEASNKELFQAYISGLQSKEEVRAFADLKQSSKEDWLMKWLLACCIRQDDWNTRRNHILGWLGEDVASQIDRLFSSEPFAYVGGYHSVVELTLEHIGWLFGSSANVMDRG